MILSAFYSDTDPKLTNFAVGMAHVNEGKVAQG